MKKEIEGKEYEQIPETHGCNGCCADKDSSLCFRLSRCRSNKTIWVEVKKEEEEK